MHDLRKQVLLESKKTTSRKARSKISTPAGSKPSSRAASRATSDNGDDEGSEYPSDLDGFTTSAMGDSEGAEDGPGGLNGNGASSGLVLGEVIEGVVDRKRSSVEGREERLQGLAACLCARVGDREVKGRLGDLLPALLKCVKAGERPTETVLALRAVAAVVVTLAEDGGKGGEVYEMVAEVLKTRVEDDMDSGVKVAALHALSLAVCYGGASEGEVAEVAEWVLEIVASDGVVAGAEDDAAVVRAALEVWGFLATLVEELEDAMETAMETFVDQLESSDAGVQIAAGENIALLYEKSYTGPDSSDDNEDSSSSEASSCDHDSDDENPSASKPNGKTNGSDNGNMIESGTLNRHHHSLVIKLTDLTRSSSKRISKADRKHLHTAFRDILSTVENPARGPRYSSALDDEGREYGSRMKVGIGGGEKIVIDAWWKLLRLNALRRVLKGGVGVHLEHNAGVARSLPVEVEG